MERLEKSSGFNGKVVTAAEGIKTRQMEEEKHGTTHKIADPQITDPQITDPQITDPHAWQSLANGRVCVQNIRDGL